MYDVSMMRYSNGEWVSLPTYYITDFHGVAKYVAPTPEFISFAIVYKKAGATLVEQLRPFVLEEEPAAEDGHVTFTPTPIQTVSSTYHPQTPNSTLKQAWTPLAGVLAGFGAAVLLIRRRA